MPNLTERYEARHQRKVRELSRKIKVLYGEAIDEITISLKTVKWKGKVFNLSDYPVLQRRIETEIRKLQAKIYSTVLNGIEENWDLANEKNDLLLDKRLSGKQLPKKLKAVIYDANAGALEQFIARKEKGLDLSGRVWKALDPFKSELEQSLGLAISKGQSAIETAKEVKKYLNEPDKLFRRVRNEEGKLVLSKKAREYKPGPGIYRSSYKNALRVTRTENNLAYRYSDYERWQNIPFVVGFEVHLSKAHPKYDICDRLKGKYPKDFRFGGWHPQCLCYSEAILNSDADFEKMEDALLAGKPMPEAAGQIENVPAEFKAWVTENRKRVAGWKSKPYWWKDNSGYVGKG